MRVYDDILATHGLVPAQVLLAPLDFVERRQYLHARGTLARLLELGVVPIVNENDAIADDEIRFGDNDRLAALVAHLVRRRPARAAHRHARACSPPILGSTPTASLIEEIVEIDRASRSRWAARARQRGSGGMASKVAAARIASWSGVRAVIAAADRPGVLLDAVAGVGGRRHGRACRTSGACRPASCGSRSRVAVAGVVVVDEGARRALVERQPFAAPGRRRRRAGRLPRRRRGRSRRPGRRGVRQGSRRASTRVSSLR